MSAQGWGDIMHQGFNAAQGMGNIFGNRARDEAELGYGKELSNLNRYIGYSERYARIIKIAQTIILEGYEERLSQKGMGGGINFALMNLGGWSKNEKSEVTHKDLNISFKQQDEVVDNSE